MPLHPKLGLELSEKVEPTFQEEVAYSTIRIAVLELVNINRNLILKELDLGRE